MYLTAAVTSAPFEGKISTIYVPHGVNAVSVYDQAPKVRRDYDLEGKNEGMTYTNSVDEKTNEV